MTESHSALPRWAPSSLLVLALAACGSVAAGGCSSARSEVERLGLAEGELGEHFAYEAYGSRGIERTFYAELYDPVGLPLDEDKAAGACRSLAQRIGELGP
jgi:hypothetical protein